MKVKIFGVILFAGIFSLVTHTQSNGPFEITGSVIADGGGTSSSGSFSLDGTIGQAVAGGVISGSPFAATSGFWNFTPAVPTAADVIVSGRVRSANGRGIRLVVVSIINSNGEVQTTLTNTFGYFRFRQVRAGDTYTISVSSRRYQFANPIQFVSVVDNVAGLDFQALP